LQDILKEGIEKEKKKMPSFLYFHPAAQQKNEEPIGEDIGFEDNNNKRDQ